MDSKTLSLFSTITICICLIISHAAGSAHQNVQKKPPLEFIKELQGSKKGDTVENIHHLKRYLHHFGYLDQKHLQKYSSEDSTPNHNSFDENVEAAIKTYQINFNLNPTGVLDQETTSQMMKPRCGVADIIDGKTRMKAAGSYNIQYKIHEGYRLPKEKKVLNWGLEPGTRRDVIDPLRDFSIRAWTGVAPFVFNFTDEDLSNADIQIGFHGSNSSRYPSDGPDGTLAFALGPTNGTIIFDAEETWSLSGEAGGFDVGTIGLHELGHYLGLFHSSDTGAIMYPTTPRGVVKGLNQDDYDGIKALYA